jgi:hypothetical protein
MALIRGSIYPTQFMRVPSFVSRCPILAGAAQLVLRVVAV